MYNICISKMFWFCYIYKYENMFMGISRLKKIMFKVKRFAGTNDWKQRTKWRIDTCAGLLQHLNPQIKKSNKLTQIPTKQDANIWSTEVPFTLEKETTETNTILTSAHAFKAPNTVIFTVETFHLGTAKPGPWCFGFQPERLWDS